MLSSTERYLYKDEADKLIKKHQRQAEESFDTFRETIINDLQRDLKSIDIEMKKQLGGVCRKLENKIRNQYSLGSIQSTMNRFFLEPYVARQYQNVSKAIQKLRAKIFQYIQNFSNNLLESNIQRFKDISLFHFQNKIKHVHPEWFSVTSRSPLENAEVTVSGLRRPQTSWLVLGVSKRLKQYGPVKKSINTEQFLGNIYLNGSQSLEGGYKLKKNLQENDVFVIENINRMIYVFKKKEGRNMEETFILDDNTDYYFYIAMKGPLNIEFKGQ